MSHFSVLVPANSRKRLEELLIPFYEHGTSSERDKRVEPYLEFDGEYRLNPNARWDWYEVGGRFSGLLVGGLDPTINVNYDIDSPLAGQVDWNSLRQLRQVRAEKDWSNYLEDYGKPYALVFRWLGLAYRLAWSIAVRIGANACSLDGFFWGLEQMLSRGKQRLPQYHGILLGDSKRRYLERKAGTLSWALVTLNGEWLEKAKMGWRGCSTNYQSRKYFKRFWEEVLSWPPDQRVYVIDCHI